MIKCIIIEDEPLAADRLKDYISRMPELHLEKWFEDGEEAAEYLTKNTPDLVFLDLHLGETSGIHLMEQGKIQGKIIITTAYPDYALKGYELDVADYLLKPFVFDRFETAVKKALRKPLSSEKFVLIKSEYKQEKVFHEDIIYIEGMGDYRRIHSKRGRIMTLQTFRELESLFEHSTIKRVHKSYMINLNMIETISGDGVMLFGQIHIPVSDTYKINLTEKG
jgi:two-component system LytT family response regulator